LGAKKAIYLQVQGLRDTWRETWWSMADGNKSEYDKIKATSVFEFWKLFDLWREKVERERDVYRKKNQQNGKPR
jgi:hypothetical protein